MIKILVVRHGYSEGNDKNVFCGQTEVDLTPLGIEQGRRVSKYIFDNYKVEAIYTSPLSRTKRTIEYLAELTGLEINAYEEFLEKDLGRWVGKGFKEIKELYPEEYEWSIKDPRNFKPVGGENYPELEERVKRGLNKIVEEYKDKEAVVVLVTHGGVIRAIEGVAGTFSYEDNKKVDIQQNATITELVYEKGKFSILKKGMGDFLGETATDGVVKI